MKKFLTLLFLLVVLISQAQTVGLSFTTISTSADDFLRPGGGANEWSYDQYINQIPTNGVNSVSPNRYWRFIDLDLHGQGNIQTVYNNATAGVWDWTLFDSKVQQSINKRQGFSFGIMTNCDGCDANLEAVEAGTKIAYPHFLHVQMQAESTKDYANGVWIPNINSPSNLNYIKARNLAIRDHINATTFMGVRFRDVIREIDIRDYGNFGEWTNNPAQGSLPAGALPTVANLDSIIAYYVRPFDQWQCVNMIAAFDGNQLTSNTYVPAAVGYFALTILNSRGKPLGWRRDNWSQEDSYIHNWLDNNNTTFSGLRFKDSIMTRGLRAPVVGEPQDGPTLSANDFHTLVTEAPQYLTQSVGNGNFNLGTNATIASNFRAASKLMGYRMVVLSSGSTMTASPQPGGSCNISLNWQNVNGIPPHADWRIVYEWRAAGGTTVLQRDTALFNLNGFYNKTGAVNSENFTMRTVPAGSADLYMRVVDPLNYSIPMPLFITGRLSDGSYLIRAGIPIAASGPFANAGPNQSIIITSATLTSAGSGAAVSQNWTQLSGPNTAAITTPAGVTTTVTGLITGTYVFQVAINGGSAVPLISSVTITVNAPALHASAGNNQTITLPTSTVSLSGSGSTGTITSYAWTNVSGPNTPTISTPSAVNTTVTGLIQGTYVFGLSVNGGASTAQVTVTVLGVAAPVANAGPSQTITVPTSSVTVSGSGSSGTITSYSWTLVSGPAGSSFANPAVVSTTFSGLVQGVYVVKLTLNGGSSDTLQVTVNPVQAPPSTATVFTTQTPNSTTENDGQALELGMKFRSSAAGYITGIRFYKTTGNNGTHTGQLYTAGGVLMASVVFTTESATGWQTAQVVPAVPILANTTYVVAYFSPTGTYVSTNNYFTTAVVTSPLTALAEGTDGHNGVFKYTATPAFPNSFYQKTNYWVDVVFSLNNPGTIAKHTGRTIYFIENLNLR